MYTIYNGLLPQLLNVLYIRNTMSSKLLRVPKSSINFVNIAILWFYMNEYNIAEVDNIIIIISIIFICINN